MSGLHLLMFCHDWENQHKHEKTNLNTKYSISNIMQHAKYDQIKHLAVLSLTGLSF